MDIAPVSAAVVGVVVCFGGLIAVIIVVVVAAARRERERQEGLRQWAIHHDWTFTPGPTVDWGRRMPGRNRRGVTLALSGTLDGRPVTIAEYHHTETTTSTTASGSSTSSSTTYHYVLLMVRLYRPGPTIGVARRGALSKVGRSLFGDRATAIGHEPFDREYRVTAKDPGVVPSVLRPALVQEHLAGGLPEWSLEGHDLLTYRRGHIGDPATIPGQFTALLRVATHLES